MSVEQFIAGLEERGLLSDRLMTRLRAKLAQSDRPLSAKAIAKFLVEKNHLTEREATEVLDSLLQSGVDIDPAPEKETADVEPTDEITPLLPAASAVDIANHLLPQIPADAAEEDTEGSSIFEAVPSNRIDLDAERGPEEELTLAPDSELDALEADKPAPVKRLREEEPAGELPELADLFGKPASTKPIRDLPPDKTPFDEPLESPAADFPALEMKSKDRQKKKPQKRTNEWDSPLLLIGGGALAVLLLGGLTIAWLLNTESADEVLTRAQKAVDTGSYTQAITEYRQFLEKFPRHRERSTARVKLAMVQVRKATEASNYQIALDLARSELEAIENEEKFGEVAHAELAALLPRIALGLAKEAEAMTDLESAKKLVEQSSAALALAINTKYVPKSFRDEAELDEIRETLGRIERRRQSQQDLQQVIAAMEKAISAGDTRAAYAAHVKFTRQHPELSDAAALTEMLLETTAAEKAAIRFVVDEQAAETSERPTPWIASLAIANRRVKPAASRAVPGPGAPIPIACVRIDGALYALDAATGQLLWRRHVGYAHAAWPIPVDNHILVADSQQDELLCLDAATGRLVWRQAIGEAFAPPLVVGDRSFLAADSGRLYVIDMKSGARLGYVAFAQSLRVTPAVDRKGERLYLAGDHYSLYAISLADLTCLNVHHLGHAEGSVTVSPVAISNKLAVLENYGVETSRLRLMSINDDGTIAGQVLAKRLTGLATSPPIVAGRRLIIATDRGQIDVYDVSSGDGPDALTLVATRAAAGSRPLVRYAALAGNRIWVGDTQLSKYSILPTGNRLPVEPIENNFAGGTFDHPLALVGTTLIHAHRPKSRAGVVVAATDTAQGRTLWETDLALPPAGPPVVDNSNKSLVLATAEGNVFRFDETAMRSRVQDEPLASQSKPASLPPLSFAADLGQGRAVFGSPESDRLLLYSTAPGGGSARWIQLESPLACAASPFADGLIAPLKIGQVFYLIAADGAKLAAPFQPLLRPAATWDYRPAAATGDQRQFVITDGRETIYLVALIDQPQPHLQAVAEAEAPYPIESPIIVLGDAAIAVAGSSHLVRFRLPSLEPAGEANLPAPVVWGPYRAGDALLLATANEQLMAINSDGEIAWQANIEHGNLAGAPLVVEDSITLAYRKGILERRSLADGKPQATTDVEHPLAAGPVRFLQRLVLTAHDGTLLIVDQP